MACSAAVSAVPAPRSVEAAAPRAAAIAVVLAAGSALRSERPRGGDPHAATFQDDVFSLGQVYFYVVAGINPHNAGPLAWISTDGSSPKIAGIK